MNELDVHKRILNNLQFSNFNNYIKEFLTVFEISPTTITRVLSKAVDNNFSLPIFIYRRAIIFCCNNSEQNTNLLLDLYVGKAPLLLFISENSVIIYSDGYEMAQCLHSDLGKHISLLKPLLTTHRSENDLYETLDFVTLIAQLKNQISLTNSSISNTIDFIINLIYLSYSNSTLCFKELNELLEWHKGSNKYNTFIGEMVSVLKRNGYGNCGFINIELIAIPNINPDIFSLIYRILKSDISKIDTEILGSLIYKLLGNVEDMSLFGHQTSYQNVDKLLRPLFKDEYFAAIEKNKNNVPELLKISKNLIQIKFFDPTNGPGCFLASAFSGISELIFKIEKYSQVTLVERILIENFIGLVNNDISKKLTSLTMWVAYSQYLSYYNQITLSQLSIIHSKVNIRIGNQLTEDWGKICENNSQVFVIGSPTFKGGSKLTNVMKSEMKKVFQSDELHTADYSSAWLYLASKFIKDTDSRAAFVLTNSVCQGEQVAFVWKKIFDNNCQIDYAYQSFKWVNSTRENVGVSVIIIGIGRRDNIKIKKLFFNNTIQNCTSISPYLLPNNELFVNKRNSCISRNLPPMRKGNMPYDNGFLLFDKEEKEQLIEKYSTIHKFIKRFVGAEEFINGVCRYCFWIPTNELYEAKKNQIISEKIKLVYEYRQGTTASIKTKNNPHQFREFFYTNSLSQTLLIPSVSSENREYIPIGFVYNNTIVSNLAFTIYNCELWLLPVLVSKIHQLWVKTVCGKLESRNRYSNELGYNTFPFPEITKLQKDHLNSLALELIKIREEFCEYSLGELYSSMPPKLKQIHNLIDEYVDACYSNEVFTSNTERLELMFKMYSQKIESI